MSLGKKILLTAILGAISFSAVSQEKTGFYLGGKLGVSVQNQFDRKLGIDGATIGSDTFSFDGIDFAKLGDVNKAAFSGGVSAGYDFKHQFDVPIRLELEYVLRSNGGKNTTLYDDDSFMDDDGNYIYYDGSISSKMKARTQTVMLHGYWDIETGTQFKPYLTAGLGVAHNRLRNSGTLQGDVGVNGDSGSLNERWSGSGSKSRFAWAVGTGIAYEIDKDWTVDLGYRFLDAGKVSAKHDYINALAGTAVVSGYSNVKVRYHDVHLGVRYAF